MTVINQVTPVTIPQLTSAAALTGNEVLPVSQGGVAVKVAVSALPQGISIGVVVFGGSGTAFPNSRTLAAGTGIKLTDGGALGNLTISTYGVPSAPPATATSSGVAGTVTYDSNFLYVAVGTNVWKRAALSTW